MTTSLRFLVVDGYARQGREDLQAGGASSAGQLYERMLRECSPGCDVDVVYPADPDSRLDHGKGLDQYDGVAWTGSSLTIYKDDPRVTPQIEFARAAFEAGVPGFGSCWAAQIAVVAAGGVVAAHPHGREMGLARKIALTSEGRGHPLYTGKKSVFDAFISHDDEITHLPSGATLLAGNDYTRVQAVSVIHKGGEFWGLQYHPEYDLHEMARLIYCRSEVLTAKGFYDSVEAAEQHVDQLETLFQDPGRKDIAWKLGLDDDVMNSDVRQMEVRNWIDKLVIPSRSR